VFDICELDKPNLKSQIEINPFDSKLFSGDVFSIVHDSGGINVRIETSRVRSSDTIIPGVLILADNKTYGRKNKKLLYRCVPDDVSLPAFLVPYEIKVVGFSKKLLNMYVTFSYVEWTDKHPHGILKQTIGTVDILGNFYEYQLYCKQLNISMQQFQKSTADSLKNKVPEDFIRAAFPGVENRELTHRVFSIDPNGSLDFDDAFSVAYDDEDEDNSVCVISVYIANVSMWLDALGLWESFTRRVSTIYLPDKKRTMLPSVLSDNLCSLKACVSRPAVFMDVRCTKDGDIVSVTYGNCFVRLYKNYCYEETALLNDPDYIKLLRATLPLSEKAKYMARINDSHDVVAYLMILMNYRCAKTLMRHKTGIFRALSMNGRHLVPETVPVEIGSFIQVLQSARGKYVDISRDDCVRHELLDVDAYIHITSPIRRLVDLLNMVRLQEICGFSSLSKHAIDFVNQWTREADLDIINRQMKSIRKVQNECNLLELCTRNSRVLETVYDGYIYNKTIVTDDDNDNNNNNDCDADLFKYQVYLPEIKMSSQIKTTSDFDDYACKQFKLFVFHDAERFKQKIRLQLID